MFSYGFPRRWSTLRKLLWLKLLQGAAAVVETVTDNLPLVLANAMSHAIVSMTRYGLCTQDGTPTPDAPVDIMCNNGALKWDSVNQRVYADGTPEVLMVRPGEHIVLSASDFAQDSATKVKTAQFIAVQPGTDYVLAFDLVDTVSGVKYTTSVAMYNADGDKLRSVDFDNTNGCRSGQFTADSNEVKVKVDIHGKTSSDTITPADIVSFAFDTRSTSYDPAGKNLFNRLNCVYGAYINNSGGIVTNSKPSCCSYPIQVDSNKSYTFSGISSNVGSNNKRVCFYKANDSFISAQASAITNADVPYSVTFTPPENTAYCRLSLNTADTEVMLEEGSTQTAYEPYIDASWQTASVPMLLSVGDYKDEDEIISGLLTHKVGIKVLDGTEDGWTQATTTQGVLRFYLPFDGAATPTGARAQVASTHFAYAAQGQDPGIAFLSSQTRVYFIPTDQTMTDTTWKAWLAAQYAAGTPVIVVYPLATATTEQTTAQQLVTNEGTNVVDSVANVSPLSAECVYMKAIDATSPIVGTGKAGYMKI